MKTKATVPYLIRDIPGPLWARVGKRATRDGVKLRSLFLLFLEAYDDGRVSVEQLRAAANRPPARV